MICFVGAYSYHYFKLIYNFIDESTKNENSKTNKLIQCHGFKFRCPNEVVTFGKPLYISL